MNVLIKVIRFWGAVAMYPINNQRYQYLRKSEQLYRLAQTFLQ